MNVEIRATHVDGFRSGEWALVVGLTWLAQKSRPCYRVRFVDGQEDVWPVKDERDAYEFRPAGGRDVH